MVSSSRIWPGRSGFRGSGRFVFHADRLTQGTPDRFSKCRYRAEPLRVARRKHHRQPGIDFEQARPCFEQRGLLTFQCAARDHEPNRSRLQKPCDFRFLRGPHIELQVSGNADRIRRGTRAPASAPHRFRSAPAPGASGPGSAATGAATSGTAARTGRRCAH